MLATLVMGRSAVANILEFDLVPVLVGTVVLLALTTLGGLAFGALVRAQSRLRIMLSATLFGLTVWAVLQYVGFPLVQPLVTEKGFTPEWYALSFGVFGVVLGLLLSATGGREEGDGGVHAGRDEPAARSRSSSTRELSQQERLEEWRRRRGQSG